MKVLKGLNIKMKSINENKNTEYKYTRIKFCYISAGILALILTAEYLILKSYISKIKILKVKTNISKVFENEFTELIL